ncbi:hypothetical protein [Acetobacterium tundrae]|uniref:Uncharacterized protein n=1 Tax=Acetobacterium tundrae TaxID=132932 RepID=A0ABR6WI56_9FIRM|nr:hypothetical protein [Acetobacterium tundrae]MBC3795835.1 hypothetical protein [Acetobacterium tundrae]
MEKNDIAFGHDTVKYVNSIGAEGLQTGAYNDLIVRKSNRLLRSTAGISKGKASEVSDECESLQSLNETKPNSGVAR